MPTRLLPVVLVVASLVVTLLVVALDAGMTNTPWETVDSAGHAMGFNDRLSAEHYRIALSNFRFSTLGTWPYAYSDLLIMAQVLALFWLLRTPGSVRPGLRWFLGLQGLLFPLGWLTLVSLPRQIRDILGGAETREGFIDVPFVVVTAQPVWVAVSGGLCLWSFLRVLRGRRSAVAAADHPGEVKGTP